MRNCINFETNNIWFQEPQANALVHKGESITLFVSKGEYTPELYPVPYLLNLDVSKAITIIKESGDTKEASKFLGRYYFISGTIELDRNKARAGENLSIKYKPVPLPLGLIKPKCPLPPRINK